MSRALDLVVAAVGLVIALPLLLVAAGAVLITSGRPILYRATRVGQGGRLFSMMKLRTMRAGGEGGDKITAQRDTRVTAVGRWLRFTKVDELPQLINVVRGEMALVGPRPEDPELVAQYPAWAMPLLDLRPGITSPASLWFCDEVSHNPRGDSTFYAEHILPEKLRIDWDYFSGHTLWSDLMVLVRTARVWVIRR